MLAAALPDSALAICKSATGSASAQGRRIGQVVQTPLRRSMAKSVISTPPPDPTGKKRYLYDSRDQLRLNRADFMVAYNFTLRLETLGGHARYEYICDIWTSEPDRFIADPIHQVPGLNI